MSICINCGKFTDKTYGDSSLLGVYCRYCANELELTAEQIQYKKDQLLAELKAKNEKLQKQLNKDKEKLAELEKRVEKLEKAREQEVEDKIKSLEKEIEKGDSYE